jgi:hypothetical protein
VKELNTKAKDTILESFQDHYASKFVSMESSKPLPTSDITFNDFHDMSFLNFKSVHILSIDIYFYNGVINGFDMNYLLDGSTTVFVPHQRLGKKDDA